VKRTRFLGWVVFLVGVSGTFDPHSALADDWSPHRTECNRIFSQGEQSALPSLKKCVALWLTYWDRSKLSVTDRQLLVRGITALHRLSLRKNDSGGSHLANQAASEVGIVLSGSSSSSSTRKTTPNKRPNPGTSTKRPTPSASNSTVTGREPFQCPEVSSKANGKAKSLVSKGVRAFRKKKRKKALEHYLNALKINPCHENGLFNAAAEYAFAEKADQSVELLQRLADIGSKGALKRLNSSRIDPDFEPIHNHVPYKKVSGFARMKIFNSLVDVSGYDLGEHELYRIEDLLKKFKYPVEKVGLRDKVQGRKRPVVFYKEHSAATAYVVAKIVGHPGVQLRKICKEIYPDWETDYDIVVTWGNRIKKIDGEPAPAVDYTEMDPDKQEKRLDNLRKAQDDALRKPEEVARKVDHAVETPERIQKKIEGSIDRVKKTTDTIGRTLDKIGNL
jgi:tetratricopeptide (TPR) repeat protein